MTKSTLISKSQSYQYNAIDLIKFLCAILVFTIHIEPFRTSFLNLDHLNFWLRNCICRIAVPFYFISSGFLLFRKIDFKKANQDIIKDYCFRILRLLGTWTFLAFVGGNVQLWYMGALVLAVIILSVLIHKGIRLRYIAIASLVLYILGLFGDSYYGIIEPLKSFSFINVLITGYDTIFVTTRNGVFFGLLFVFIGIAFAKIKVNINATLSFIGFVISVFFLVAEVYLLRHYSHPKDYNLMLSLIPASFFLFNCAIHINLENKHIYAKVRVIGMLIFYSHLAVNFFLELGISTVYNLTGLDLNAFTYILSLLFSIIFATCIEHLSKHKKYYWLKYLYS